MPDFIKVKSSEISLTTANTVGGATVVRILSPASSLITFANADGTIGTYTMTAGSEQFFVKGYSDTVAANTAVLATAIAYK